MACDMTKLANFSVEKQQLISTCIDSYTGDLANFGIPVIGVLMLQFVSGFRRIFFMVNL